MIPRFLVFVIAVFVFDITFGQPTPEDTLQVREFVKKADSCKPLDANASLQYAKQALQLANEAKWKKGVALGYATIGNAYYDLGQFNEALKYRLLELQEWRQLKHRRNVAVTLGNVGVAYSDIGDLEKAIEYYNISLDSSRAINLRDIIVQNLGNIGCLYDEQHNYEKAIEYYNKALKAAREYKSSYHEAINSGNLGGIYSERKEYQKALHYLQIAIDLDLKNGNTRQLTGWFAGVAGIYHHQLDSCVDPKPETIELALQNYNRALKMAEELGDVYVQSMILGNLGQVKIIAGKLDEAIKDFKNAEELSRKIQNYEILDAVYNGLYRVYKKQGKYDLALINLEKFKNFNDSSNLQLHDRDFMELQVKFDVKQKEIEKAELQHKAAVSELALSKQRLIYFLIAGAFMLVLSFVIFFIRQRKIKADSKALLMEQKLLRSQMNPHFLFNSLANIESFIYDHQPKEAGIYLSKFSRLMRLILENSSNEYIPMSKEIETLEYYLSLQQLRLNDSFEYSIVVPDELKSENVLLPPMLTQPFIENSIEHGFNDGRKGRIDIRFSINENQLIVEVKDNGIGFNTSLNQKHATSHNSTALKITEDRIKFLNKGTKAKHAFEIKELDEGGTLVIFSLPVKNYV